MGNGLARLESRFYGESLDGIPRDEPLTGSDAEAAGLVTDAPDDYIAQMKRAIIGLEIPVARFEGKWKTSQNQPADNQAGVVAGLAADGQDLMAAIVAARAAPDA